MVRAAFRQVRCDRHRFPRTRDGYVPCYFPLKLTLSLLETVLPSKYTIGRIVGCQADVPYQHCLMGSLTCSTVLLVKICGTHSISMKHEVGIDAHSTAGEPEPQKFSLYMVSSRPFEREEYVAYRLAVAISVHNALAAESELEQRQRIRRIMSDAQV